MELVTILHNVIIVRMYFWDIFNLLSLIQCGQVRLIPLTRLCHTPTQALKHLLQPGVLYIHLVQVSYIFKLLS